MSPFVQGSRACTSLPVHGLMDQHASMTCVNNIFSSIDQDIAKTAKISTVSLHGSAYAALPGPAAQSYRLSWPAQIYIAS